MVTGWKVVVAPAQGSGLVGGCEALGGDGHLGAGAVGGPGGVVEEVVVEEVVEVVEVVV